MWTSVNDIRKLSHAVLARLNVPAAHIEAQVELLIEAEMRGLPSHGLLRLPRVVERIKAGLTNPHTTGVQTWAKKGFLKVDGERGLGPVVALCALDTIIERAGTEGIAVAAINNTNHLGALAFYAEHAARRGVTCIALTISEALVHPFGGRTALIGTNPIAIGVPADPEPMILDMATSLVAMGKIHDYAAKGLPIPLGWALDGEGKPTTNAAAAKAGSIAPFGGPKGYALGVAFEVLVASLACSAVGAEVHGTLDSEFVSNKGDVLIAISPPNAVDGRAIVSAYLDLLRTAPPVDPQVPVLTPGDRARASREQAMKDGLHIDDELHAALKRLAYA